MSPVRKYKVVTKNGFEQEITVYQAINCKGCPIRWRCHKSKSNREIHINHKLRKFREQAKKNLTSPQGIKYRKKRSVEPESVFGQVKQNKGFRRFYLRGKQKIEIEFGLVLIAHNIQKLWKWLLKQKNNGKDFFIVSISDFFSVFLLIFCLKNISQQKN